MKVTHLVRQFHPSLGGLEDFVSNLAGMQRDRDIKVDIVTLNRNFQTGEQLPQRERWQDIEVMRVPFVGSRRYPVAPAVLKHLRTADILHVHAIDFFVDYLALLKSMKLLSIPVVVSTHGGIFHTDHHLALKKLFFRSVSRLSLRQLERVVCCSVGDLETFSTIRPDLTLIENGIVPHKFGAERSGVEGDALLYIGRLSVNKNLPALMRGVDAANDRGLARRLIIVGRSSSGDMQALKHHHSRLRHRGLVELLVDSDDAEIRRSIRRSRYVVSASRHEGFGLTIPELMSYGLIPVLNDIPPFRRFVEQSGSGVLFGDADPLPDRLATLPRDENYAEQSRRARRYAESLRWELVQERFTELYHALLA